MCVCVCTAHVAPDDAVTAQSVGPTDDGAAAAADAAADGKLLYKSLPSIVNRTDDDEADVDVDDAYKSTSRSDGHLHGC